MVNIAKTKTISEEVPPTIGIGPIIIKAPPSKLTVSETDKAIITPPKTTNTNPSLPTTPETSKIKHQNEIKLS
ncbi:hypothetical protein AMET1_0708 [Methanonatronarchaeum thermophilum]|uniref:Uncharacterized protein n=1 Tax=Methanonatronarchaeum thermophilum TaxID=1927129 RepID=A0A1Y3GI31_9EURY|nr:hypothetical protein AMET1_0708 [Methanonatronarchaeum thermophilum]